MAEFASAAESSDARAVIYATGFDHDMVQHALVQAGGNEQLAIDLILNGEVHDVATASSSVASISAPAVSFSGPSFGFGTAFAPAEVASSSSSPFSSSLPPPHHSCSSSNAASIPAHVIYQPPTYPQNRA